MEIENKDNLIKHFARKGFLIDREILDFFVKINNNDFSENILAKLMAISGSRIINKSLIIKHLGEIKLFFMTDAEKMKIFTDFFLKDAQTFPIEQKDKPAPKKYFCLKFKILNSNIIPYRKIEVKDFVTHFKNRYNFFKDKLKERKELTGLVSIDKIGSNRDFSIIGMVAAKRVTKNKNIILEVEDLTGRVNALVRLDKEEIFNKAKEVVSDEVIGLKCSGGRDFLYVNDIFFLDSFVQEKKKSDEETYALFISDTHIGSTMFYEKNFLRFLNWLNGEGLNEEQKERVKKIRYIFVVGDCVDGVGVYPSQESFLKIKDIKEQYKKLAEYISMIPKYITVIMCPGQHDAVRLPEPQPPIDKDFAEDLTKLENVFLVSNPSNIEIECANNRKGFNVLIYHGASMHGWIDEIEDLRMGKANLNPSKIVKYMLRHRHLSPIHSANVYLPGETEDSMVIREAPDIIATGDMHRTDVDMYHNTLIICSSCWQSITPFEEKVGNQPDPCKVPMLNLKTREIKIMDFSGEEA